MLRPYSKEQAIERMNRLADAKKPFVFIISYLQDISYIEEINALDASEVLYDLNGFTNVVERSSQEGIEVCWKSHPESVDSYRQSFEHVMNNICAGNSFLTNLTCITPITTNLTLKDIFFRSRAMYKLWVKDAFTVFSPEIFIRIQGREIRSFPMKGTIDAMLPNAEWLLMNDAKEAAEHATIVDLIRNDLSMVANQVTVGSYRYIDRLQTSSGAILQTSSEICGILPDDFLPRLGEILFRLLPAGSITGAPKCKTMDIIAHAEHYERGFYTGITGCFDGKNLDSAVMIRFVEQRDGALFFKSGGGITCNSDMESEYNEMKQKIYVPIY